MLRNPKPQKFAQNRRLRMAQSHNVVLPDDVDEMAALYSAEYDNSDPAKRRRLWIEGCLKFGPEELLRAMLRRFGCTDKQEEQIMQVFKAQPNWNEFVRSPVKVLGD
jgi:hypothetical protein